MHLQKGSLALRLLCFNRHLLSAAYPFGHGHRRLDLLFGAGDEQPPTTFPVVRPVVQTVPIPYLAAQLPTMAPTFWVDPSMRRDRFARLVPEAENIFPDVDARHGLGTD
jgi:hypothetical protein